jgi:hypothetical protein
MSYGNIAQPIEWLSKKNRLYYTMNYSNPELVGNLTAAQQRAQTAEILATIETGEAAYEAAYWRRRALLAEEAAQEADRTLKEIVRQRDNWKKTVVAIVENFGLKLSWDEIIQVYRTAKNS